MDALAFVVIYILGGLTFLPIVLACAFLYTVAVCPKIHVQEKEDDGTANTAGERALSDHEGHEQVFEYFHNQPVDVAAGYFAMSRDFVPGGLSGQPPDYPLPSVPGISESPSVYQSMYRSLFERGKAQHPTTGVEGWNGRHTGKTRNVFYVVLR